MREWLKNLREKKGMTQQQVATMAGISPNYYSYIENGNRCEPDKVDTEKKIAEILEFDWTKFFQNEESTQK